MTEYKKLETQLAQRQKLESLGTLASGIAHEIRSPLTVIMNGADLLHKKVEHDEALTFYTAQIIAETKRVSKIVSSMLSFARQDVFEQDMVNARMDNIVEEVLSLIHAVATSENISFHIEIPADLPTLRCHPQQIQQVLLNLLTNARDALLQDVATASESKIIEIRCTQIIRSQKNGFEPL